MRISAVRSSIAGGASPARNLSAVRQPGGTALAIDELDRISENARRAGGEVGRKRVIESGGGAGSEWQAWRRWSRLDALV